MKRIINIHIEPTPTELAKHIADLDSINQVKFLNTLARFLKSYKYHYVFQLQEISNSADLSDDARYLMEQLGVYAYKLLK